jgi:predicted acyltransferase
MTIAGMILVNSPGNETCYAQLDHSAWNGCTFTDLVFPFFLFIVGVSLAFSLTRRLSRGESPHDVYRQIAKRSLILFALGLGLNGFPSYHLSTIRLLGVLQRIALCYSVAAVLFVKTRPRTQAWVAAGLLVGYWLLMTHFPVPGYGAGILTKEGNLAAYVDRMLLAGHMYRPVYDPEGLLSTLPAIATTLLGNLTGSWLLSGRSFGAKLGFLGGAGILLCALGWIWGFSFPINKALWTSSYVLWTGGLALLLLGVCSWLVEVRGIRRWSRPFEIFGLNAIAVYVMHVLGLKIQNLIHIGTSNLRFFLTEHLFGGVAPKDASLLYALSYTFLWFVVLSGLYRKRIFLKI